MAGCLLALRAGFIAMATVAAGSVEQTPSEMA
jgi:hypothetical protein